MDWVNPFNKPEFSAAWLTRGINQVATTHFDIMGMGLFGTPERTSSPDVILEWRKGTIAILPSVQRGGAPTPAKQDKRKMQTVRIPYVPHESVITPDDIENVRRFGGVEMESLSNLMTERLARMRRNHEVTWEYHMAGALTGKVLDADGSTMVDLFTLFAETQVSVDFVLGTTTTPIHEKCLEVLGNIDDNLNGDTRTGYEAKVHPTFFKRLVNHAKVREDFRSYAEGARMIGGDPRQRFPYGGIFWSEYRGPAPSVSSVFSDTNNETQGIAFPVGTMDTFQVFDGPPYVVQMAELVREVGIQPIYVTQHELPHGAGVEVRTQSNRLPICRRPKVLIEITSSN